MAGCVPSAAPLPHAVARFAAGVVPARRLEPLWSSGSDRVSSRVKAVATRRVDVVHETPLRPFLRRSTKALNASRNPGLKETECQTTTLGFQVPGLHRESPFSPSFPFFSSSSFYLHVRKHMCAAAGSLSSNSRNTIYYILVFGMSAISPDILKRQSAQLVEEAVNGIAHWQRSLL